MFGETLFGSSTFGGQAGSASRFVVETIYVNSTLCVEKPLLSRLEVSRKLFSPITRSIIVKSILAKDRTVT